MVEVRKRQAAGNREMAWLVCTLFRKELTELLASDPTKYVVTTRPTERRTDISFVCSDTATKWWNDRRNESNLQDIIQPWIKSLRPRAKVHNRSVENLMSNEPADFLRNLLEISTRDSKRGTRRDTTLYLCSASVV
jgi:hypothetical protein